MYVEIKGTYTPSDINTGVVDWNTQTWSEAKYSWINGQLKEQWIYESDWKPVPFAYDGRITYGSAVGPNWEPVFHAAVTDDAVYLPDLGGTITKVNKTTGKLIRRINPFGATRDTNIFVTGRSARTRPATCTTRR